MRRSVVTGFVVLSALVGSLTVAGPAEAASISITCPGANTTMVSRYTIAVDDVLEITASSCQEFQIPSAAAGTATYGGVTYGPGSTVAYSGGTVTYTPPQARMLESQEIQFNNNGVSPAGHFAVYVTVTAVDTPVQTWFQSVGRPLDGVCDAGWGASWEQWPNGGTGGFTCNRIVNGIGGHAYPTVVGNPGSG